MLKKLLRGLIEVLGYIKLDVESIFRRLFVKKDYRYHSDEKKHFTKGEWVESKTGEEGRVWRLVRDIKTGKIVGCIVVWEETYKNQKYSILPSEDRGIAFNPIIRKKQIT